MCNLLLSHISRVKCTYDPVAYGALQGRKYICSLVNQKSASSVFREILCLEFKYCEWRLNLCHNISYQVHFIYFEQPLSRNLELRTANMYNAQLELSLPIMHHNELERA